MATYAFVKAGTGFTVQKDGGDVISKFKVDEIIRSPTANTLTIYMGNDEITMTIPGDTVTINGGAPTTNTAAAVNTQLMTDVF